MAAIAVNVERLGDGFATPVGAGEGLVGNSGRIPPDSAGFRKKIGFF